MTTTYTRLSINAIQQHRYDDDDDDDECNRTAITQYPFHSSTTWAGHRLPPTPPTTHNVTLPAPRSITDWKPRTPISPEEMSRPVALSEQDRRLSKQGAHTTTATPKLPSISSLLTASPPLRGPSACPDREPSLTTDARYTTHLTSAQSYSTGHAAHEREGHLPTAFRREHGFSSSIYSASAYHHHTIYPDHTVAPPHASRHVDHRWLGGPPIERDSTAVTEWSSIDQRAPSMTKIKPHHRSVSEHSLYTQSGLRVRECSPDGVPVPVVQQSRPAQSVAASPTAVVITANDTLGPKIWTGTHFLPRFVRQADVPGEGTCYFYDDGTHCKTVIEGELVNAHWGVTKAGKPRKRLAIACLTCREKKIKCDPDYPRCVQCAKYGRVCRFKNAPRGGAHPVSPNSRHADIEDDSTSVSPPKRRRSLSSTMESLPLKTSQPSDLSPAEDTHRDKRARGHCDDKVSVGSAAEVASPYEQEEDSQEPRDAIVTPKTEPRHLVTRPIDHDLLRQWQTDPCQEEGTSTVDLLDVFFSDCTYIVASVLPAASFKNWAQSRQLKTLDELMLIYAVLALGSHFSPASAQASTFATVARYACENRHITLPLILSRLILSVYYTAIDQPDEAWGSCGAALRSASLLGLNMELDYGRDADLKSWPCGLTRAGYAESRRRTFWACHLTDCLAAGPSESIRPNTVRSEDIFLRLPCDRPSFEEQRDVANPFFDAADPILTPVTGGKHDVLTYLIIVAVIFADINATLNRYAQRPGAVKSKIYLATHQTMLSRLRRWHESLPANMTLRELGVREARTSEASDQDMQARLTMFSIYHLSMMRLHRYVPATLRRLDAVRGFEQVVQNQAQDVLEMARGLARHESGPRASPSTNAPTSCSHPIVSDMLLCAIDVLRPTASSTQLADVRTILQDLSESWPSVGTQYNSLADWTMAMPVKSGLGGIVSIGKPGLLLRTWSALDTFQK